MKKLLTGCLIAVATGGMAQAASEDWQVSGGTASIKLFKDPLPLMGITVNRTIASLGTAEPGFTPFSARSSTLKLSTTPGGGFKDFTDGRARFVGGLELSTKGKTFNHRSFSIVRADQPGLELAWVDTQSNTWFTVTDTHSFLDPSSELFFLKNGDLRLGNYLAKQAGLPEQEGAVVGMIDIQLDVTPPKTKTFDKGANCSPAFGPDIDLLLTGMANIGLVAQDHPKRVAFAPSAQLRNVGNDDIRWYWAIDPPGFNGPLIGPHPLLVMHYYRLHEGRFEMIGKSDVKHAFNTVNSNCGCNGGQVMFVGCEDNYGVSSNSDRRYFGPRDEIRAYAVSFTSLGSHFDNFGAAPEFQDNDTRSHDRNDHDDFEHLLVVPGHELSVTGATYFAEAWYLVAGDTNILNSMGHRETSQAYGGTFWSFSYESPFELGPAINSFVDPAGAPGATNVTLDSGTGLVQLACATTHLTNGIYRYSYALMNHDYDPKIQVIDLPLLPGVTVSNLFFNDPDTNGANDWVISSSNTGVHLTAPAGNELDWACMISFGFDAAASPGSTNATLVSLEGAPAPTHSIKTLAPILLDTDLDGQPDLIDEDDDNDQMPDVFEIEHGFDPLNAADAISDSDGDRVSNLGEYLAHTNPTNDLDFLSIKALDITEAVQFFFDSSTQRIYSLEMLEGIDGTEWLGVPGQTNIEGQGMGDRLQDTNPPNLRTFYRLRVEPFPDD